MGKKLPSIEEFLTINVDYFINSSNSTTSLQSLEKINDLFSFDESELTSQEFDNDKKITEILEKSQATTHQLEPLEIKISLSPNPILIPQINSQIAEKFLDLFQRHRKHKITQEITAKLAPAILAKSPSATSIYDISKLSNVDILKIRELLNGELIIQTPAIQDIPDQEITNKKIIEEIEEKIYDKLSSFTFGCAEEFQSPKLPSTIPKLQQIFHRKLDYLCKKIKETMGYNDEEIKTLTSHIYTLNGYCVDSTQLTKDQTLSNYDLLINQRRITGLYEGPGHASNATQEDLKKMIWVIDKLIKIDEKFTQELLTSQPSSRLTPLRIDDTPTHPISIINFEKYLSNLPFQNFTLPKVEDIRTALIDVKFTSCDDKEFLRNLLFHFKENPCQFPEIEDIKTHIIELVANNLNSQAQKLPDFDKEKINKEAILNATKQAIRQEFSKCHSFDSISKDPLNPLNPIEIISLNTKQQKQFFEILLRKIDDLTLMISNNSQNFQSQVAGSGIFDIKDLRNKCKRKFQKIKSEFDDNALAKQNQGSREGRG